MRRRRDRCQTVKDTVRHLLASASALAGTSAVCIDPMGAARYAEMVEPFRVLGDDHAASLIYEFTRNVRHAVEDRPAVTKARLQAMIARLAANQPIRQLSDRLRENFRAASYMSLGICESWRDGPECLRVADQLEQFSPMYAMSADHIRANHYNAQGDLKRALEYRQRVEVHAVQLGSAWQVETWAPADQVKIAVRANDATMLKRAVQELSRLSSEVPTMAVHERCARGNYLVLRGKYEEAIPLLDYGPEYEQHPGSIAGWSRTRGALARAYNGLGQHGRAREICLHVMTVLSPEDLLYVFSNLNVQVELALAEAGLGELGAAGLRIDNLLALHEASGGLLTLGVLHEARARIALKARDFALAREHAERCDMLYRKTDLPGLIALGSGLKRALNRSENARATGGDDDVGVSFGVPAMLRVQLMLSAQNRAVLGERAARGLQIALELSSADAGFIVLAENTDSPVAHLGGDAPNAELVEWAKRSMLDAADDEQTVMTEEVHSELDSNYRSVGDVRYCVVPLWARQGREDRVVAALVLGFHHRVPRLPAPAAMRAIAMHLIQTVSADS